MTPENTNKQQNHGSQKNTSANTGKILFKKGQSGNPKGRPKGSLNKATLAVQALLDGEAENLTRKAIELAQEGDTTAMKLCLERIIPAKKDSPVTFRLPAIKSADDVIRVQAGILRAISQGAMTPIEASRISSVIGELREAFVAQELESRISMLEAQNDYDAEL
jgi:hypothetical protein